MCIRDSGRAVCCRFYRALAGGALYGSHAVLSGGTAGEVESRVVVANVSSGVARLGSGPAWVPVGVSCRL
eukprot:1572771-Prorocentrum_lima.AAC.1